MPKTASKPSQPGGTGCALGVPHAPQKKASGVRVRPQLRQAAVVETGAAIPGERSGVAGDGAAGDLAEAWKLA